MEQLVIVETTNSLALRFSFRIPEFNVFGRLTGYRLEHLAKGNLISEEDYKELGWSVNRMCEEFLPSAYEAVAKKFELDEADMELVEFRGVSYCYHLCGTKVLASDPRWT